jgi:D-alanyl-D-alanine carboxypeptidase
MRIFCFCCCVFFISVLHAQHPAIGLVQHYLDSTQKANGYPGMTISFQVGDQQPISLATGTADSAAAIPMKPNAIMLSGSTPKMFYAVVVMRLANSSLFSLDDKIEKWLGQRSWFDRLPNAHEITIRQLLQHSSGIPEYYGFGDFLQRLKNEPDKEWTLEELIGYVLGQPATNKAGDKFSYADTNYLLLGLLVEAITGRKMYDWVDEIIIRPLKMKNTRPSNSRKLKGLIPGYSMPKSLFGFSGATIRDGLFVVNPQFELMGGGYVSNTSDWLHFLQSFFSDRVLDSTTRRLMMKGIPANTGREHQYGLGLQIRPSAYGLSYGHGGWFPGYLTEVAYFPEKNITIAMQCNTDDFARVKGQLYGHLLRIVKLIAENK